MAFTPTTWVDNGAPGISAAQLNRIETGISDAHAAINTGIVQIDSFDGASDTAKLNAAISYALAQTRIPWLQLPARSFSTGSSTFAISTGLKILGPGLTGPSRNLEVASETAVPHKWRTTCGSGSSALLQATSEVYNTHFEGIAFHGNSTSQIFRSTVNTYSAGFGGLTFYGCMHAFGRTSEKWLGTQARFTGHWTSVGHANTQMVIGGSDMEFAFYYNINSGGSGAGKPNIIFDSVQKSIVHYLYVTAEGDWTGLRINGTQDHDLVILGSIFEGRSQTNLASRPLLEMTGGVVTMLSPDFGQVSDVAGTVNGAIHQSGGQLRLLHPYYRRGSAVAATFPLLYQTGGTAQIVGATSSRSGEQVRIRWANGDVVTAPAPANSLA